MHSIYLIVSMPWACYGNQYFMCSFVTFYWMKVVNQIQNDSIRKMILSFHLQYLDHFSQLSKKPVNMDRNRWNLRLSSMFWLLQVILELSQSRDLILKQTKYFYFRLSEGKQKLDSFYFILLFNEVCCYLYEALFITCKIHTSSDLSILFCVFMDSLKYQETFAGKRKRLYHIPL